MTRDNEKAIFAAQQQAKAEAAQVSGFTDYPTCDGHWWYEHAPAPVAALAHRAYGSEICVYLGAWLHCDEVRKGWWHGPIRKPESPKET